MLARKLKVMTLEKQKRYLIDKLTEGAKKSKDGNAMFVYSGTLYPEVINYFKKEGFKITLVKSELLCAMHHGMPTYLFEVCEDIELTAEEKIESEEYAEKAVADFDSDMPDFMKMLLGGAGMC